MKKSRDFRPMLQPLEERVVLSFSFTGLIHSLLPFIKLPEKKAAVVTRTHTPVTRKAIVGKAAAHLYAGPRGKAPSNSTALEATGSTKVVPMYGPYTGPAALAARRLQASRLAHLKG